MKKQGSAGILPSLYSLKALKDTGGVVFFHSDHYSTKISVTKVKYVEKNHK
jgi:hypothetical protein